MGAISIAFVDDHPILLQGIETIFRAKGSYDVVATGSTSGDAVGIARAHKPDVIVMDLNMPGDAFEAIAEICSEAPGAKVIAFTASPGIEHAVRALEAGASGYVLKGSSAEELSQAISAVVKGETFITQSFATKVITALRNASLRRIAARAIKLSIREDQIIKLLLRGRTNKEIALHLNISEKTVKHYMTLLMQKLQVRNRLEVVIAAQKLEGAQQYKDALGEKPDFIN